MLLTLANFTLLFYLIFSKAVKQSSIITAYATCCFLLAAHFLFEGYRWQMIFAYIITILLGLMSYIRHSGSTSRKKVRMPIKYGSFILLAISMSLSVILSVYLPVFQLPEPNGPSQVGTVRLHLIDKNRSETLTEDKDDKRKLMAQLWYPAQGSRQFKGELLFPYEKEVFDQYIATYSEGIGIPKFVLSYWKDIHTNSIQDAGLMPSTKPYPIIIISHGMGTGRVLHTSQAENLASHGFVVLALDHTYSTSATAFPDGRVVGFKTQIDIENMQEVQNKVGAIWEKDIEFILAQLKQINEGEVVPGFTGMLDLNNTGIMGHSFGGAIAYNAVNQNDHIKAGINMDGSFFELQNSQQLTKPFLFMASEDYGKGAEIFTQDHLSDEELEAAHLTRENYQKLKPLMLREKQILEDITKVGGAVVQIQGAAHYNFTDFQLFSELIKYTGMTGKIKGERGAMIVNQYVLDFFHKHLKGEGGILLEGPNPKYPEVKFLNRD